MPTIFLTSFRNIFPASHLLISCLVCRSVQSVMLQWVVQRSSTRWAWRPLLVVLPSPFCFIDFRPPTNRAGAWVATQEKDGKMNPLASRDTDVLHHIFSAHQGPSSPFQALSGSANVSGQTSQASGARNVSTAATSLPRLHSSAIVNSTLYPQWRSTTRGLQPATCVTPSLPLQKMHVQQLRVGVRALMPRLI